MDLIGDDLNSAAMYLNLASPPSMSDSNPGFYIIPNQPITGAAADGPSTTDELYFYMDLPHSFEGELSGASTQSSGDDMVLGQMAPQVADKTYTIDCKSSVYADQVKEGQSFIFKDSYDVALIKQVLSTSGSLVTVLLSEDPNVAVTGLGATLPLKERHIPGTGVTLYTPGQMVRYAIQMMQLDPKSTSGVPCLVREQGNYSAGGFVSTQTQIITENVSGFKVYLSANSGTDWAGFDAATGQSKAYSGFVDGWTNGIRTELNTQLAASGRPGCTTTQGLDQWFRDIPTLVRLDLTTRTATKRTDFSTTKGVAKYQSQLQTLVIVPRHFGLTMK
jgi:hypothetical protein